ncbi:polynucleotide 5'-hydroxyl-kinase NOL9-like [Vespa mandarinia]|uniref:polynucleotide 5'-hydroxyl-kinase NOL9-like n=1 Tax=Vespa mandarinia TaxID=7446 RepID=UPI001616C9E0|nr:polynucleotide 5'-hydroxyl-kinase NOL9-like [Vespa mandarinia]XP_035721328.1 polynucleotide 5'-hydroxyl-kinase NOL9-like [Vespa mandarinia]
MNISCDLDKHNLKKSYKDTSIRRNSLPECVASSSAFEQKKNKNYDAFNKKAKKTIKMLSKNYDGMKEYHTNVSSNSNDSKIVNSTTYGTVKMQENTFETRRSLGPSMIVESVSMSNITDSTGENKNKSLQEIFNDLDMLQNDSCIDNDNACIVVAESINPNETSTIQYGHRKNQRMKFMKDNEKSQSKYLIGKKKTSVVTRKNEVQECTENSTMRNTEERNTKSKVIKEKSTMINTNTSTGNYNEKLHLYCLHNKVLMIMQERTSFCFTGKLMINVLYGAIEVYGSHITTSNPPIEVYSPKGYSLITVETSNKFLISNVKDIWTSLSPEGINPDIKNALQYDINQCKPGMTVIILWNLENNLTGFVNTYYPIKLFPKIRNVKNYSWTDTRRAEMILQSNLYLDNHNYKKLIIDPTVTGILAEKILNRWRSNDWSCTLIAGGKNVGKSTTVRYLINTLLPTSRMVVLVDVDPGQNECTPPGSISYSLIEEPLTGPNFTHLKMPVYQLYIGDVNVTRCITRYIECVKLLANKLLSCPIMSRLPIIVNTMGFTQGIGWDIVVFTIKLFRPSFVLQIMSERTKNNYPNLLSCDIINQQTFTGFSWSKNITVWNEPCCHELQVINTNAEKKYESTNDSWNMEPYQQRELAMISYLSGILNSSGNSTFHTRLTSLSINEVVPYVAPFASLTIALLRECVPPSRVLTVINGNMVALCGIDLTSDLLQEATSSKPRILTRAPLCACYGYGIIRGIDMEKEELYINTPLPLSLMRHVNCLIGSIPVPINLLQLNQPNVPYAGGNDALPTSRDPRRGYFRMRYQNRRTSS